MEYKYDKARYNKTYYEKNKEKLRAIKKKGETSSPFLNSRIIIFYLAVSPISSTKALTDLFGIVDISIL